MTVPMYKRMSSGRYINILNITTNDVDLKDIERSLNYTYRFSGHWGDVRPLTVAQHSLLCFWLAQDSGESEDICRMCLTHDFAEAYIGDVTTPVKRRLGNEWREFADPIETTVGVKFNGDTYNNPENHDVVKVYDSVCLDIERRTMWSSQYGKDKWPEPRRDWLSLAEKKDYFHQAQEKGYVGFSNYL